MSNSPTLDDAAKEFFQTATTNLLEAEATRASATMSRCRWSGPTARPGERYFQAKRLQEELISAGPIPYSIVHATQFLEFVGDRGFATVGDEVHLPQRAHPADGQHDVAEAVAIAAVNAPMNGIIEVGGPQQFRMPDLIRTALIARGDPARSSPTRRGLLGRPDRRAHPGAQVPERRSLTPGSRTGAQKCRTA